MRPFPAGLVTDVGLLVANPALARADTAARVHALRLSRHRGLVLAAGACWPPGSSASCGAPICPHPCARSSRRRAPPVGGDRTTRSALRTSELWSWSFAGGRYRVEPFGRPGADVGRIERRAALEHGVSRADRPQLTQNRYFAWKLISLPSSGRASSTPPAPAADAEDARVALGEAELIGHVRAAQRELPVLADVGRDAEVPGLVRAELLQARTGPACDRRRACR